MIVNDILKMAKAGAVAQLPVRDNNESLIMFTYLGVSMLYQRFNMLIKAETMKINEVANVYELRNDDLGLVLSLYNQDGKELKPSSVTDGVDYDYKQLSYRTFLLKDPKPEFVMFVYSAAPSMFTSVNDPIDIPVVMVPALLDYVAYMAHSTVNTDQNTTSTIYYTKFDKACNELEALGYKVTLSFETLPVQFKGY